jgi:hypothetical protein
METSIQTHNIIIDTLDKLNDEDLRSRYLRECYVYFPNSNTKEEIDAYTHAIDTTDINGILINKCDKKGIPRPILPQIKFQQVTYMCDGCVVKLEMKDSSKLICPVCEEVTNMTRDTVDSREVIPKGAGRESMQYAISWWYRMTGRDPKVTYDKEILPKIKRALLSRSITNKRRINCDILRDCLVACNLSKYNYAISYIYRDLTGMEIGDVTKEEDELIIDTLARVVHCYKLVHGENNNPYCAFFILKVTEQHIKDEKSLMQIVRMIHVQESETTRRNDEEWAKIAPMVGLEVKWTDITKYKK